MTLSQSVNNTKFGGVVPEHWRTTRSEIAPDGAYAQTRYAEFGKGRPRVRSWRLFRDGSHAGYAVNDVDADANCRRVLAGFECNAQTGNYEVGPRRSSDNRPMCGVGLKAERYPIGHRTDESDPCSFRSALGHLGNTLEQRDGEA